MPGQNELVTQLRGAIDKGFKEAKQEATQARTKAERASEEVLELREKIKKQQDELKELRQAQVRSGRSGGGRRAAGKSLGAITRELIAQQENATDILSRGVHKIEGGLLELRVISGDAGSAGALVPTDVDPEIAYLQRFAEATLLALIPRLPTSSNNVEVRRRVKINYLSAKLQSAVVPAAATITLSTDGDSNGAAGFKAPSKIILGAGTAQQEEVDVTAVDYDNNVLSVTGVVNNHNAGDEVTADDFVFTPETKPKPYASAQWDDVDVKIKTLAILMDFTKQILEDADLLQAEIEMELPGWMARILEKQILYGDGTGRQLQGILTDPAVPTYLWSNGTVGDSKIDCVRRAITIARLAERPVDFVILNPADVEEMELLKDSQGRYIKQLMVQPDGSILLWRVPVIETTAILSGDFLVGAFRTGCRLYDRQQATTQWFEQNKDNVEKNLVTMRTELRLGFVVKEPAAFVYGRFDSAPV